MGTNLNRCSRPTLEQIRPHELQDFQLVARDSTLGAPLRDGTRGDLEQGRDSTSTAECINDFIDIFHGQQS